MLDELESVYKGAQGELSEARLRLSRYCLVALTWQAQVVARAHPECAERLVRSPV